MLSGVTGELKVLFSSGKVGLDLLILNERCEVRRLNFR
jgi:hypothetical protein